MADTPKSMDTLIDKYQRLRLRETGGVKTTDGMAEMDDVKRKIDVLGIAFQALYEILQPAGVTENALLEKMQEIDQRDGKLDGKTTPAVVECTACGRKSNVSRNTCVYCGAPLPLET